MSDDAKTQQNPKRSEKAADPESKPESPPKKPKGGKKRRSAVGSARKLTSCARRLKTGGQEKAPRPGPADPIDVLLTAILEQDIPKPRAVTALNKLRTDFIDWNELRVATVEEICQCLGKKFPSAEDKADRIIKVLGDIFKKNNAVNLSDLTEMGKREARGFLESLTGISAYAVACVMLLSFEAHAIPVNDRMLDYLKKADVIDEDRQAGEVQTWLERQFSGPDAWRFYLGLHAAVQEEEKKAKTPKKKR